MSRLLENTLSRDCCTKTGICEGMNTASVPLHCAKAILANTNSVAALGTRHRLLRAPASTHRRQAPTCASYICDVLGKGTRNDYLDQNDYGVVAVSIIVLVVVDGDRAVKGVVSCVQR